MMWLKRVVYRRGYRPKVGSVFYSPSMTLLYALDDAIADAIAELLDDLD